MTAVTTAEVAKIPVHLLERKARGEEALGGLARKPARRALAAHRGDLLGIGLKGQLEGLKRRRPLPHQQGRGARSHIIRGGCGDGAEARLEALAYLLRHRLARGASHDHQIMTQT